MPSTTTDLLRIQKMATSEKVNTWGTELNDTVIELLETAIAGTTAKTVTGSFTLATANWTDTGDEHRPAFLNLTGSPAAAFTVTLPAVSKGFLVRNATGQTATFDAGGTTIDVLANETVPIFTNGTDVFRIDIRKLLAALDAGGFKITNLATPTADADAVTKLYADAREAAAKAYADTLAFDAAAGNIPGISEAGNIGFFLEAPSTWRAIYEVPAQTSADDGKILSSTGTRGSEQFIVNDPNSVLQRWRRKRA